jgi:hypothetical protein
MKLALYSIYDSVAEVFHKLFTSHNDRDAIRAFTQTFSQGEQAANREDYSLWRVAEWHDNNGEVKGETPVKIMTGFDIKNEE